MAPDVIKAKYITRPGWYYLLSEGIMLNRTHEGDWFKSDWSAFSAELDPEEKFVGPISHFNRNAITKLPRQLNPTMMISRAWRNKEVPDKVIKILPWFQPLDDKSQFDFKALLGECDPVGFSNDVLANFNVYSGLVMQCGWQMENDNGIWICIGSDIEDSFEDLGSWQEYEAKQQGKKLGDMLEDVINEEVEKQNKDKA